MGVSKKSGVKTAAKKKPASLKKDSKKSSGFETLKNLILGSSKKTTKETSKKVGKSGGVAHSNTKSAGGALSLRSERASASASKGNGVKPPALPKGKTELTSRESKKAGAPPAAFSGTQRGSAKSAVQTVGEVQLASQRGGKAIHANPQAKEVSNPSLVSAQQKRKKPSRAALLGASGAVAASPSEAVCREVACEGLATTGGYCRLHYIKNWKKIKRKELILREKKLNQYIEELVAKYPDKYIEAIRQDLVNDKEFAKVIHDLDLDENVEDFDVEGESVDSLIDHLKRDFDDEGEAF